ncbi:hypothetical protein Sjap_004724 [Stephania japonica]|uniref:Pectinesterase inhibitor domain-containing protein n=1 Tax=Stephania japonica TaxID=461633 RepID=A0AAP0PL60_9MAGN
MKLMQFFSSSLLVLCCALFFDGGVSIVNGDLIADTCHKIADPPTVDLKFCIEKLEADPSSRSAKDLRALLGSAIKLIKVPTADVNSAITKLTKDPKVNQPALAVCKELFGDAADHVDETCDYFVKSDYDSVRIYLSALYTDADTCKEGFEDDLGVPFPPPLVDPTNYFYGITKIALSIADLVK